MPECARVQICTSECKIIGMSIYPLGIEKGGLNSWFDCFDVEAEKGEFRVAVCLNLGDATVCCFDFDKLEFVGF